MKYNKFFLTTAIAVIIAITSVFMANHLQAKAATHYNEIVNSNR